ncbi:hypothetical protein LL50_05290 [Listeria monocytogenes]|nr:hypothetical protein [Listeria monocytogenes]EAD0383130.1 hypothetical protein [Listeria monocytogenes]EAE9168076.1 hypothetical protein [Listeria monocytogenes]EAF2023472.1 hypothetical protein [Listeria monocytogenes]EDN8187219.1 hypothetical protein [Listeria monocytogenes]
MSKLKLENADLEMLKTKGNLIISETEAYEVIDVLQVYQDFSKVKERFIVRRVETGEQLELVIVRTFRSRTDLVGRISSATTKPLTSALKKRLTNEQETVAMSNDFRDKLATVKRELGM